ncbi:MAG: FAD-binding oxidoreductase [Candidatus Moranbacteria bacterium]|nr:FAD-binding oxidoreductase [Candidatus Moranbacteria bacterium]
MHIVNAFQEWSLVSGVTVLHENEAMEKFAANTIGAKRRILGVLGAQTVSQVQAIVAIANKNKIPLYPISGGRNWGYGSAVPTTNNCVILDLSSMNNILELNEELSYVTLEPGVTQEQLHEYFKRCGSRHMVPTTGAGPQGSIIGNALEKGYGITPHEDHFEAMLCLKAVLPSGEIYESALAKFGGYRSDTLFRWKIGPYLEGLFAQGNVGIVVQATIALAQKPREITQFLVFIDDKHFEDAITGMASIKKNLGSLLGGVNIMNKRRLLAMIEKKQEWIGGETLPEVHIRALAKKRNLSDWVIMGGLYCPNEVSHGAISFIRSEFRSVSKYTVFLNRKKVNLLKKLLSFLPVPKLKGLVSSLERALDILEGVPSTVALALAYLKNHHKSPVRDNLSPDKDECGLIWYSPLLPVEASFVRDYTQEITRICLSKGIEPLITLTTISERCFDSTVPILFDQNDEDESARARECHRLLLDLSKEMGVFPYRVDIDTMRKEFDQAEGACFTMMQKIKKAIDPNNIIAPGRYIKHIP